MKVNARKLQGWMWGALLVFSVATAAVGFFEWIERGDAAPPPDPLTLDQPGMPFGPPGESEDAAPLPEGFVPDLPAVPTLPQGKRPSRAEPAAAGDDARLDELAGEMRLVQEARSIVASQPAAALSLLDQHRQRYPQGALREEREAYAIEALHALGRTDEVERRYLEFREDFPDSALRERLDRLLQ